jgi:hypothetical protein
MATTPVRTFKTAEDCNIVTMANGDLAYGHMTTGGANRVTPASYLLVRIIEKATRFTVYLGKSLPTAFQGELNLGVTSNLQFATVASLEAAHDLLGSDSPLVETTEAPVVAHPVQVEETRRELKARIAAETAIIRGHIGHDAICYARDAYIAIPGNENKGREFVDSILASPAYPEIKEAANNIRILERQLQLLDPEWVAGERNRLECQIRDAQGTIKITVDDHERRLKTSLQTAQREGGDEARMAWINDFFAKMHRTGVAPSVKHLESQIEYYREQLAQLA